MNPNDKPTAHSEVVLREEFDDWAVLFHPDTGEAVGAGPVGVAIFRLLDGQHTLEQVASEIETQFEDVPDSVLEDTVAFVDDLHQRQFVSIKEKDEE